MQELIEHILTELDIPYDCKEDYIHTHNPFQKDEVKSCQIFYNDGTLVIFNGVIEGKNRLTITIFLFTNLIDIKLYYRKKHSVRDMSGRNLTV